MGYAGEFYTERPNKISGIATAKPWMNAVEIVLVGAIITMPFTSTFTPSNQLELPSINYSSSVTVIRRLEMKTIKFKPSKAILMKAISEVKNASNRGTDVDYRKAVTEEMRELEELRRRANSASKL